MRSFDFLDSVGFKALANLQHDICQCYRMGKTAYQAGNKRAALVAKTRALIYTDRAIDA